MADRNTLIRGSQVRKGYGLENDASNLLKVKVYANNCIALDGNGLAVDYDNSTIGIITNKLAVKDGGIPEVKLDVNTAAGAGVDGYALYWNNAAGKLDYKAVLSTGDVVLESDVIANEIPTGDINGSNPTFVLANVPESATVQVYLNGLLQEPGSGKDYQLSSKTITFGTNPDTGDIVLCNYIKAS
jgi:hypothetical protein